MKQQTVVKTYTARKAPNVTGQFQRDSQRMAQQGYRIVNQSVIPQRAGCFKKLFTLGMGAGETTLTATYELTEAEVELERERSAQTNENNAARAAEKTRQKAESDERKREEKAKNRQRKTGNERNKHATGKSSHEKSNSAFCDYLPGTGCRVGYSTLHCHRSACDQASENAPSNDLCAGQERRRE